MLFNGDDGVPSRVLGPKSLLPALRDQAELAVPLQGLPEHTLKFN